MGMRNLVTKSRGRLKSLLSRRAELVSRISAESAALERARRAVALCDRLSVELPAFLDESAAARDIPRIQTGYRSAEDAIDVQFLDAERARAAVAKFIDDIPRLRKHWAAELASLERK